MSSGLQNWHQGADVVALWIKSISERIHLSDDGDASDDKTHHRSDENTKRPRVLLPLSMLIRFATPQRSLAFSFHNPSC